ncbi:putative trancriptional regulator, ArsR family [Halanaeroarchaeum sp. HSR-CO]|uniref:DUF7344 domain-containing protein n=1 Tax=Halanaeroarchaeum sp. HSR-CO TaxID=2866382 RepID=UPI00217D7167|nr:hypothetical protein [Halanaeroarchaeum sp. HSR-CO]UWG47057.1 putative trancriptional regulator, ArsR family [Halanaeroarchaeum sp. HSR-CO]
MTTDTHRHRTGRNEHTHTLTPTDIFSLLADSNRRHILQYLSHQVGEVPIEELAAHLAPTEDEESPDQLERILIGLYHSQLPALVDAAVVYFDHNRGTVTGSDSLAAVRPYLDLAFADEAR